MLIETEGIKYNFGHSIFFNAQFSSQFLKNR